MLKKTIYFCEFCGEVFEDYDSCNLHEMEEMAKHCEDSFKLFDKLGEVKLNLKANPASIMTILCDGNKEAVELLKRYFTSFSCKVPPLTPGEEALLVFNECTGNWCNIDEAIQKLKSLF
jgi:hypothetical protein